jgi:hypothetical protein
MKTNFIVNAIFSNFISRGVKHFCDSFETMDLQEMDVIEISKAGYITESEIKRSYSDFKADFRNKKFKHENLKNRMAFKMYDIWKRGKRTDEQRKAIKIPNYFYYVCPHGLIKIEDIPEYAGLIYVSDVGMLHYVKIAPRLHREKATYEIYEKMASKLAQRLFYGSSFIKFKHQAK